MAELRAQYRRLHRCMLGDREHGVRELLPVAIGSGEKSRNCPIVIGLTRSRAPFQTTRLEGTTVASSRSVPGSSDVVAREANDETVAGGRASRFISEWETRVRRTMVGDPVFTFVRELLPHEHGGQDRWTDAANS